MPQRKPARRKPNTPDDERAFLAAIRADLDDDTPRLIFADWLEERGDPRAEFIRVQCELARTPEEDPAWAALDQREEALLKQYKGKWMAALPRPCTIHYGATVAWGEGTNAFQRGFVTSAALTVPDLNKAQAVFAGTLVHRLMLAPAFGKEIAGAKLLQHATSLRTNYSKDVDVVFRSPYLTRLRTLALVDCGLARFDAAWPVPPCLTRLDVGGNTFGDAGAQQLARWPGLSQLRALNLSGTELTSGGLLEVLHSPTATQLEDLAVINRLGTGGLELVARATCAKRVRSLNIQSCQLERITTEIGELSSLEWLVLDANVLGPDSAAALASAAPTSLRELRLNSNRLRTAGVQALAKSNRLDNLVELDLVYNDVGEKGLLALAESKGLAKLRRLDVRSNPGVTPKVARALRARFGDGVSLEY
jgi:uncharacterized protein (TIGR02996 family)